MAASLNYLDELHRPLLEKGDEWMLLSQLDGFLAGILVSPELAPPSQWLSRIWAGDDGTSLPEFKNAGHDLINLYVTDALGFGEP